MTENETQTHNPEQQQIKRTRLGRLLGAGISKLAGLYVDREAARERKVRRYEYSDDPSGIQTIDVYTFGDRATVDRSWVTAQSPDETVIIEHTDPQDGQVAYTVTEHAEMYQNPSGEHDHGEARHWVVRRSPGGQLGTAVEKPEKFLTASDLIPEDMHMGTSRRVLRVMRGSEPTPVNDVTIAPADEDPAGLVRTVLEVESAVMDARLQALES